MLRGKSPAEILHLLSNLFWDCSHDTKKGVSNRLGRKKTQKHCKTGDEIAGRLDSQGEYCCCGFANIENGIVPGFDPPNRMERGDSSMLSLFRRHYITTWRIIPWLVSGQQPRLVLLLVRIGLWDPFHMAFPWLRTEMALQATLKNHHRFALFDSTQNV